MSAYGRMMDIMTRRQIFNERFAKSLSKQSIAALRKFAREVGIVITEADLANGASKTLLAAINRAATQASDEVLLAILPDLLAFADAESKFTQAALRSTTQGVKVKSPTKDTVEKSVKNAKFKLGHGKEAEKATLKGLFAIFGNIYKVGEGPHPALHYNCRSIRLPLINTDVAMSVSGGSRVEPDGTKINARATYGGWLKEQPKDVQDEVLGVKRAELFRSDKLSIGKFTDDTGKVYTLEQLKAREPLAFS